MAISILGVAHGSFAARMGIQAGETLVSLNGEPILDEIDYQSLSMLPRLKITVRGTDGAERTLSLRKPSSAPLGLKLDERTVLEPRVCKNHCIFCFVDQMPAGMRPSLYVKDDDWRLSLMMGNFVTLTNVDDTEFDRILRRKASPLYISVQATDPQVRIKMLRNPSAGNLMTRLRRMKDAGLRFHCQVVLCPGVNDGQVLYQSITDLANLYPAAQSLAIVPIGLTGFREGLYPLRTFQKAEAQELVRNLELIADHYQKTLGTRFVFPADELYSAAGLPMPAEDTYEGFPQIENGIGMVRKLQNECAEALIRMRESFSETNGNRHPARLKLLVPTGESAFPYIRDIVREAAPPWVEAEVFSVPNRFFGPTVTVTGLIVGRDLIDALKGHKGDRVLISCGMLRENENQFLDDWTVDGVSAETGFPIRVVRQPGEDLVRALWENF